MDIVEVLRQQGEESKLTLPDAPRISVLGNLESPMKLFIVVKCKDSRETDSAFEFIGVFDSEEKAVAACVDVRYGIGPAILNEDLGDEREDWPDFYYPHAMPLPPKDT
jgi:hypothetical protein